MSCCTPIARFHFEGDHVLFEIVDAADVAGDLAESLFISKPYSRESGAMKAANDWLRRFSLANEAQRRKMIGLDPISKCGIPYPAEVRRIPKK